MRVLLGDHDGNQQLLPRMPQCLTYSDQRRQALLVDIAPFLLVHRWPERGSTGWQLRHEGVSVDAVDGGIESTGGCGEVGGAGVPGHVNPAHSAQRDAPALIETCPPQGRWSSQAPNPTR
jgi:hypothetical protein